MSPEVIGAIAGALFVAPTIYLFRRRGIEHWAWPAFLVTLPVYYMLFGVLALDAQAIANELLYGLPFIAIGLIGWRYRSKAMLMLVGVGWLAHGLYDYYHDVFFVNPGVWAWYPAFCAVIDIAVGIYLFVIATRLDGTDNSNA